MLLPAGLSAAVRQALPVPGVRVAPGFRVTQFADSALADDIQVMTLDARGDVVVSGPGYIRTLIDENGDGVADRAIEFGRTPAGGMGMCFDGADLLFVGDGGVWRFRDANGDRQADAEPERILTLAGGEHGAHAIHKGPDGLWYVMGGNDSQFDAAQFNTTALPGSKVEGGALVRFGANNRGPEIVAQGFRNAYDFDFNEAGEAFTYDSDVERDFFLPWYVPTRIYHVAPWSHHGWRLKGYMRSWPRLPRYLDSVDTVAETGRGSPTGVVCYRHQQFPARYYGGLFAADWTFGRIYFLPLEVAGSTYRAVPEIFLESTGTDGFAPTAMAIAPDGSLFISTGGRRTRGAVYHVQYMADAARVALAASWRITATSDYLLALGAPQPLAAWSRAVWEPVAARLDPATLGELALDVRLPVEQQIRAIEILTEFHGGLTPALANAAAQSALPWVRMRAAWSVGTVPPANASAILLTLARDAAANVRGAALQALFTRRNEWDLATLQQALAANLIHPDNRVRQDAARLAMALPPAAWNALWKQQQNGLLQARLTVTLALLWRTNSLVINTQALDVVLGVLGQTRAPELQAQALRLSMLALGDYRLEKPTLELYTGYETALPLGGRTEWSRRLDRTFAGLIGSSTPEVNFETARLLAMIESSDPAVPAKIIGACTAGATASSDFHYLTAFSKLTSREVTNHTKAVAQALLGLDGKLEGQEQRPKQAWADRFVELAQILMKNDPRLPDVLLNHPHFARAAHLPLVPLLGAERYLPAARLYYNAVQHTPDFPWSEPLVDLLAGLPPANVQPLFRRHLNNVTLRDRLLLELAGSPRPEDRGAFLAGLASARPEVLRASMSALLLLPNDPGLKTDTAVLHLLRSLLAEPGAQTARAQALTLLSRLSGQKFGGAEKGTDLAATYRPVFEWFESRHPGLLRQLDSADQENAAQWEPIVRNAPWARGDAAHGSALFVQRGCQGCHAGARAVGPDLAGVTERLSIPALFNAILFPSRDIAPAYRMTTFHLRDGQVFTGLVAFESAEETLVQNGPSSTVRLAEADIAGREASLVSFMPSGLLAGLNGKDLADLHAYLKTLSPPKPNP